ncbi:MAG: hypothetical protein V4710_21130, partial [Verrucomicrobiota bacterium]
MSRLAVFHSAAAFAFAGVFASATFVAALATTLAFAGVLARTAMGVPFWLLLIGQQARGGAIALG